jgi:hypothetical protein
MGYQIHSSSYERKELCMCSNRWQSILIEVLVSAVLFLLLTQGIAFAASHLTLRPQASCSGDGCTGSDPYQTKCADSKTYVVPGGKVYLFHFVQGQGLTPVTDIEIDLKYSPTCGTNWAEWHEPCCVYYGLQGFFIAVQRSGSNPIGENAFSGSGATWGNSPMVYAPSSPAQACGLYPTDKANHGACTPFF